MGSLITSKIVDRFGESPMVTPKSWSMDYPIIEQCGDEVEEHVEVSNESNISEDVITPTEIYPTHELNLFGTSYNISEDVGTSREYFGTIKGCTRRWH